jgi:hypothetical protein
MHYAIAVLPIAVTTLGTSVWAYQDVIVSAGGRLVGTVALEGAVPKPKGYNVIILPADFRWPRVATAPAFQSGSSRTVPRRGGKNPAAVERIGPRDRGIFLN